MNGIRNEKWMENFEIGLRETYLSEHCRRSASTFVGRLKCLRYTHGRAILSSSHLLLIAQTFGVFVSDIFKRICSFV